MKILSEGKWKDPWSLQATCTNSHCLAVLDIEENDLRISGYKDEPKGAQHFVECPVCKSNILIHRDNISARIITELNKMLKPAPSYYD